MANIVVILPAYNEELTIAGTIESFYKELPDAKIAVVNNNSTDSTVSIAQETFTCLGAVGEVLHEDRQGKVREMLCEKLSQILMPIFM